MTKLKGLGRGLDALLTASKTVASLEQANTKDRAQIIEIKLDKIRPGKFQPRKFFDEQELQELADSIKHNGLIQPIVVRQIKNGHYEIIAGERRFRASGMAGFKQIPVIIRDFSDQEALAVSLIENIQRKDLNAIEEALGYKRLIDEFKLTHSELSKVTSRSRSHITNILRLLNLHPEVQEMVICGQLDMGHARALLPLPVTVQLALANVVIDEDLTTAEVERRVAKILHQNSLQKKTKHKLVDPDIENLEIKIADKLGMMVNIKHGRKGSGKIVLSYSTLDELDNLLELIG
ncbi:MAG: chromosome partitioning protein ParB [Burkholderiales bacterium]|jgi:ParB family chromosome partitioning protein|nr:chromosome partitioning protein ParB [Burkholderiales bacterium]